MLKIFHNNFFENLSDPIPPFFTTKKFGLLTEYPPVALGELGRRGHHFLEAIPKSIYAKNNKEYQLKQT